MGIENRLKIEFSKEDAFNYFTNTPIAEIYRNIYLNNHSANNAEMKTVMKTISMPVYKALMRSLSEELALRTAERYVGENAKKANTFPQRKAESMAFQNSQRKSIEELQKELLHPKSNKLYNPHAAEIIRVCMKELAMLKVVETRLNIIMNSVYDSASVQCNLQSGVIRRLKKGDIAQYAEFHEELTKMEEVKVINRKGAPCVLKSDTNSLCTELERIIRHLECVHKKRPEDYIEVRRNKRQELFNYLNKLFSAEQTAGLSLQ